MNINSQAKPRHYCGLFGVYGVDPAPGTIYNGLFSIQHRGQEGAGIAVSDGHKVRSVKGMGLVNELSLRPEYKALKGHIGIGHVRYSTTGSSRPQNVQPLVVECMDGIWGIAHNGNLTNARSLRRSYQEAGAIFQTSTDSEILLHLIADPMYRTRPRRVERALAELQGAFSFLLMTRDTLMAARDPYGFRPLSIGTMGDGYAVASETCALEQVGAKFLRDVKPGELITIDDRGLHSSMYCEPVAQLGQCIFEHVYFARPDSNVFEQNVHASRMQLGRNLALEHPVEADLVTPIPDSGNAAALGYSQASGIPLDYGFIRNHYIGRTFIMPTTDERTSSVDMKLAVVPGVVRGKRIIVVDDSLIRGTTSQRRVRALREAGAREIHLRISCPPTAFPCYFGIDFPSREELIASNQTVEEIRNFIGADSLGYLSLAGLKNSVQQPHNFCTGCFTGIYPYAVPDGHDKHGLESG
ncbi:MAG: amidophosphoribosyltransferase [Verrucomicrobia bacterium]|nr:amidophosphoribosyltransferase [Kiritimatiellia bacterium]MCP5487853.1 amidophosphoribosyltransferase [Verrucomicrobiota bacterium]